MTPQEVSDDLARSREAIGAAARALGVYGFDVSRLSIVVMVFSVS